MDLRAELSQDSTSFSQCKTCQFLAGLETPKERNEWLSELKRPVSEITHAAFSRALNRRGFAISIKGVANHRAHHQ